MAEFETAESEPILIRQAVWVPLLTYLVFVVIAETVAAYGPELGFGAEGGLYFGIGIHVIMLFTLLVHASILSTSDPGVSRFLVTFTLIPIIRILSLGLPLQPVFTIIQWLFLISLPLLAAAITLMYAMRLRPKDVYLRPLGIRQAPVQAAIAVSGLGLGVVEFFILRPDLLVPPEAPWIPELTLAFFVPAAIAIGLGAGLTEEIIFRGLLQPRTEEIVGKTVGLVFVAVVFAAMHIGFRSGLDLVFVFAVGLYFGYVVQRTRNLIGVTLAHALANVSLYLLMPFFF